MDNMSGSAGQTKEKRRKTYQDLDPETRMKRIAQNRAAQKAFRERKERKMRELEKKVVDLESLTKLNEVETGFLRDQLSLLVKELKKYRPETKQDSKVLRYLEKYNSMQRQAQEVTTQKQQRYPSTALATGNRIFKESSALPPGATIIRQDLESFNEQNRHNFNNSTGQLTPPHKGRDKQSSVSTSASNSNSNSNSEPNSEPNSMQDQATVTTSTGTDDGEGDWLDDVMKSHEKHAQPATGIDFNNYFDEQISEFCGKLNQACGTKTCPIPQSKSKSNTPLPIKSVASVSSQGASPGIFHEKASSGNDLKENLTADPAFLSNTWADELSLTGKSLPEIDGNGNDSANVDGNPGFGQLGFGDSFLSNDLLFSPTSPTYSSSVLGSGRTQEVYRSATVENTVIEEQKNKTTELPFINSSLAFPDKQDNSFFRDTDVFNFDDKEGDENFESSTDIINDIFGDNLTPAENKGSSLNSSINEKISTPNSDKRSISSSLKPEGTDSLFRHSSFKTSQAVPDLSLDSDEEEENDESVVPSGDDGLLRCSEIWDRITAHPKYSDIDIDGLCSELMAKAKCSERGVVINADDVQVALNKHMA